MNQTKITTESGKQELFIEREFDAPKEKVSKAFSDPKLYVQWLGPKGYEMTLEKFEPRTGGSYRYIHKDKKGQKFAFHGVYHLISPERSVDTFEFEGMPGHVSLEIMKLEELSNNRSKLKIHSIYESIADRDGMVSSGMEQGLNEGFEKLDELLKRI